MSEYGKFIDETLNREYTSVSVFKDEEHSKIELYQHKNTQNKLVKIQSQSRNDHIFRTLRGLKHENLPTVFDVCSCEEYVLVLESYIEGETLANIIEKNELAPQNTVAYMLDICNALNFLHKRNIVHRDVKPSNVIITPENKAVLIDLSAARLIHEGKQKDTTNLGTVGYAAPEQYGVYQSLPPTDIYALGVMFNEILTGVHPSVRTPKGRLGKIIKKCTDTQIAKRYQSIDTLTTDLKRYQKFHKKSTAER
ncbi:MAG: serine/threonine-protein kinase [Acutalibacteraceae bacterium]